MMKYKLPIFLSFVFVFLFIFIPIVGAGTLGPGPLSSSGAVLSGWNNMGGGWWHNGSYYSNSDGSIQAYTSNEFGTLMAPPPAPADTTVYSAPAPTDTQCLPGTINLANSTCTASINNLPVQISICTSTNNTGPCDPKRINKAAADSVASRAQTYATSKGYTASCMAEKVGFPGVDPNTGLNYYYSTTCTINGMTGVGAEFILNGSSYWWAQLDSQLAALKSSGTTGVTTPPIATTGTTGASSAGGTTIPKAAPSSIDACYKLPEPTDAASLKAMVDCGAGVATQNATAATSKVTAQLAQSQTNYFNQISSITKSYTDDYVKNNVTKNQQWETTAVKTTPSTTVPGSTSASSFRYLKVENVLPVEWAAWKELEFYDANGAKLKPTVAGGSSDWNPQTPKDPTWTGSITSAEIAVGNNAGGKAAAIDGNVYTQWNSAAKVWVPNFSAPTYIVLDFGKNVTLSKMRFLTQGEGARNVNVWVGDSATSQTTLLKNITGTYADSFWIDTSLQSSGSYCSGTINVDLQKGDSGVNVASLTSYLTSKGFMTAVESTFDQTVFDAVVAFQNANKDAILTPVGVTSGTGFVGASTRKFINNEICSQGTSGTPTQTTNIANPVSTSATKAVFTSNVSGDMYVGDSWNIVVTGLKPYETIYATGGKKVNGVVPLDKTPYTADSLGIYSKISSHASDVVGDWQLVWTRADGSNLGTLTFSVKPFVLPFITSVTSTSVKVGSSFQILGGNFNQSNTVAELINSQGASATLPVVSMTGDAMMVTVPTGLTAGVYTLQIRFVGTGANFGKISNTVSMTVTI